jgi:hypothetical protein
MISHLVMFVERNRTNMYEFWHLKYFLETSRLAELIRSTETGKDIIYNNDNPKTIFDNIAIFVNEPENQEWKFKEEIQDVLVKELRCTHWGGDKPLLSKIIGIYLNHADCPYFGELNVTEYGKDEDTAIHDYLP